MFGMWPWKVSKWPWFLAEVAVQPFQDLATLIKIPPLLAFISH
jgi:hypothetical protein